MLEILYDFPGRIYLVQGNNDGDPLAVSRTIPQECPQIKEFGGFIIVDFDEFRVALTHYPEHARAHAMAGDFDMVFYGHTHEFSEKMVGKTLLLNPGDIMGLKEEGISWGSRKTRPSVLWRAILKRSGDSLYEPWKQIHFVSRAGDGFPSPAG
jgi:putative phosphoesterase